MTQTDIIIIGAGAAGLMAARELSQQGQKVVVLEARKRAGGRINTINHKDFTGHIEGGAEFVHGKLPLTLSLLKEADIPYGKIEGEIWQEKNGTLQQQEEFIENGEVLVQQLSQLNEDVSVNEFLNQNFAGDEYKSLRKDIKRFVEGYDAADITRASTVALASEFVEDEEQFRLKNGYIQLVQYLERKCLDNDCNFYFEKPVSEIAWTEGNVKVKATDGNTYEASKVLITVPIGILQSQDKTGIRFSPAIPDKIEAANDIGFGAVIKFTLEFNQPFWHNVRGKDLSKMGFLFSEATVPTWWTQAPEKSALLTGWLAGPTAKSLCYACDEELLKNALRSLSVIFKIPETELREDLKAWHISNWANDPYSAGAYSYATVGGQEARQKLSEPVAGTLFFAGEGVYIGPDTGTVEAALSSGLQVSRTIAQAKYSKVLQND